MCDVTERWLPIPGKKIKRDLFRAFDIAALHPDIAGVLGVQTRRLPNVAARVAKLQALPSVAVWVKAGNGVQIHGWVRRGKMWRVKIVELQADDLQPVVVEAPKRRLPSRHYQGGLWDAIA